MLAVFRSVEIQLYLSFAQLLFGTRSAVSHSVGPDGAVVDGVVRRRVRLIEELALHVGVVRQVGDPRLVDFLG